MVNKFADTIKTYNKYAKHFANHFEYKFYTTELDKFLALMPNSAKILDAGCGVARDSAYMIEKGFLAQGIDLSEGLLAEAKKLHPEVPTQLMSLTALDFPKASFDAIWCKAALLHIDRKEIPQILRDFYQILKPNGLLFVQTKEGTGEGTQPVPFNTELSRLFTFFTLKEMSSLIKTAGFSITDSYTYNTAKRKKDGRDQEWLVIFAKK